MVGSGDLGSGDLGSMKKREEHVNYHSGNHQENAGLDIKNNLNMEDIMADRLKSFTSTELKEELQKRQDANANKPLPLKKPNFEEVVSICTTHINDIANSKGESATKQWIYEATMEAVFGKDVFDWINKYPMWG